MKERKSWIQNPPRTTLLRNKPTIITGMSIWKFTMTYLLIRCWDIEYYFIFNKFIQRWYMCVTFWFTKFLKSNCIGDTNKEDVSSSGDTRVLHSDLPNFTKKSHWGHKHRKCFIIGWQYSWQWPKKVTTEGLSWWNDDLYSGEGAFVPNDAKKLSQYEWITIKLAFENDDVKQPQQNMAYKIPCRTNCNLHKYFAIC